MTPLHLSHRSFADLSLLELYELLWLRNLVFVCGQQITAEPEVDGLDPECVHILGYQQNGMVATTRLFMQQQPLKVGRIAVHPERQGQGLGTQMMEYIQQLIGERPAEMSAQAHLQSWYHRLGWQPIGDHYVEARILHIRMRWGNWRP